MCYTHGTVELRTEDGGSFTEGKGGELQKDSKAAENFKAGDYFFDKETSADRISARLCRKGQKAQDYKASGSSDCPTKFA